MRRWDVGILGGGPAGTATALSLLRHHPELSVLILEPSNFDESRFGETLPPSVQPLLDHLGVWDRFSSDGHLEAFGMMSAWGLGEVEGTGGRISEEDFLLSPFGRGWHVDRGRFDRMLFEEARRRGVSCPERTRFVEAENLGSGENIGFELVCEGIEGTWRAEVEFVVDATGRRAGFAVQQGARRFFADRLVGIPVFFRLDSSRLWDTRLLLEPVERGWWYSTRIPDGRAVAVFMTDGDLLKGEGESTKSFWHEALRGAEATSARLKNAVPIEEPGLTSAGSSRLDSPCGPGWLAVGDAVSTVDPLSGQGISKALRQGIWASHALADRLRGEDLGWERYRLLIEKEFEEFLEIGSRHYAEERRWAEAPFWKRRQSEIFLHPGDRLVWAGSSRDLEPLKMHLPRWQWERLLERCRSEGSAHEVVAGFRDDEKLTDRRIVLALQYLVERGVVQRFPASGGTNGPSTRS